MSPSTLTYTDVYLALDGGFVERRVVPVISGVGVGPLTQQQGHHLQTPEDTRHHTSSTRDTQTEIQAPAPTHHTLGSKYWTHTSRPPSQVESCSG